MAMQLPNPLRILWRYVWGYMRGDDIRQADARAVALATAERASASSKRPAPSPTLSAPGPATDRRRM